MLVRAGTRTTIFISAALIALAALFIFWADGVGRDARRLPGRATGAAQITSVGTQAGVYEVYKKLGLRGAHVVHLNRHFNIVQYFPSEELGTRPFPIRTTDTRPMYEGGLDSHNWLFIATRTAMVRRVTHVVPDEVFAARRQWFQEDYSFSVSDGRAQGFSLDVPRTVTTLEGLGIITGPVVLNVDAGFFMGGADPAVVARELRLRLGDVRAVLAVESTDEPDVDEQARAALGVFKAAWGPDAG